MSRTPNYLTPYEKSIQNCRGFCHALEAEQVLARLATKLEMTFGRAVAAGMLRAAAEALDTGRTPDLSLHAVRRTG